MTLNSELYSNCLTKYIVVTEGFLNSVSTYYYLETSGREEMHFEKQFFFMRCYLPTVGRR
jgi:hypothetical protein